MRQPTSRGVNALLLVTNTLLVTACGGGGGGADGGAPGTAGSNVAVPAQAQQSTPTAADSQLPATTAQMPGSVETAATTTTAGSDGVTSQSSAPGASTNETGNAAATGAADNVATGEAMNVDTAAESISTITAASTGSAYLASAQLNALASTPGILSAPRIAVEDWDSARRLASGNAGWQAWVAGRRDLVNQWFAITRDQAELIAGFPNDWVDPVTAVALTWTMDTPMPSTGTTSAQLRTQQAWVAINRQYNIDRTLDAARLYKLSGDTRLAELAARQLDFYAANYLKWPLRTSIGNARMLGQSLDEAVSVLTLLEAAKALNGYASAARVATWRDSLFKPIAANLPSYSDGTLNNINLWCATGIAAVGMQFNDQALIDAGTIGAKGIGAVLAQGVTADGIWAEGSFAYNNYVLLALARFFDLAALNNRGDLVNRYVPATQRMLLAPIMFRFDDGSLPKPSDTRNAVAPVDTDAHLALYRHVPSTFGVAAANARRSWATLLDVPPASTASPSLPSTQTLHADATRMLLMRKGSWQLFVHYGQKVANHAQEEALSYELVHDTTSITRDAGTATSYAAPQHLYYFSKGVGNNVPLVDGQGQQRWSPGVVNLFDPATGGFDVSHAAYRDSVSASRSYRLSASGFSESTRITLQGTKPVARKLGVMLNTACPVKISDARAGVAAASAAPFTDAGYGYWTNVQRQQALGTSWTAQLNCNGKPYELTISGPAGHTIYMATVPNTPLPATRTALYVETVGTDVTFKTSFRALP